MSFMKKEAKGKGAPKTSDESKKGSGAPVPKNAWVKEAMGGKYQFDTGGGGKKGKRPGFGKAGAPTAKHGEKMKGMTPTHGTDGMC